MMLSTLSAPLNTLLSSYDRAGSFLLGAAAASSVFLVRHAIDPETRVKERFFRFLLAAAKSAPGAAGAIRAEQEKTVKSLREMLRIEGDQNRYLAIPEAPVPREKVLAVMEDFVQRESPTWLKGGASGAVYHGGEEHVKFVNDAYAMFSITNPLHTDLFKSLRKFEAEIVAMTAEMLHGDENTVGSVTFGGTESILMAMKAYRDRAERERGITRPEIVVSDTAHAAFTKAGDYFKIRIVKVKAKEDGSANVPAMRRAITGNTVAIVGSAPQFPSGIIDPIEELAAIAQERGIGMHVDGCLGGFFLPWAAATGSDIPPFDFAVPGVTSMSCDTHKYGFTAKGTSVVLYRSADLRRYQYSFCLDWTGGIYATPTHAGSRPGGLIASTWACLISVGKSGYREVISGIVEARKRIVELSRNIEGLKIIGDPKAMVIAYRDDGSFSIYDVLDHMSSRGWSLNGLQFPASIHICLTRLHIAKDVQDRFIKDLNECVKLAKEVGGKPGGMGPIYGQAASLPDPSLLEDAVGAYLDATLDATI